MNRPEDISGPGDVPNGMRIWTRESSVERRRHERVFLPVARCQVFPLPVESSVGCEPAILDISPGGLRFRDETLGRPLATGTHVHVVIVLEEPHALRLEGQVLWTHSLDGDAYEGGIKFDTSSDEVAAEIRRHTATGETS